MVRTLAAIMHRDVTRLHGGYLGREVKGNSQAYCRIVVFTRTVSASRRSTVAVNVRDRTLETIPSHEGSNIRKDSGEHVGLHLAQMVQCAHRKVSLLWQCAEVPEHRRLGRVAAAYFVRPRENVGGKLHARLVSLRSRRGVFIGTARRYTGELRVRAPSTRARRRPREACGRVST